MNDFVIYTDSACDIPPELLKEWGVPYSWLTYVFDGDARQYSNYELPSRVLRQDAQGQRRAHERRERGRLRAGL